MVSSKDVINLFKTPKLEADNVIGGVGFDNARENIDPTIKTKTIHTNELTINYSGRYIAPYFRNMGGTNQVVSAGKCFLLMTEVPYNCIVDGINISNGSALSGSAYVGVYSSPSFTGDSPVNGTLLMSGSALTVGTSQSQVVLFNSPLKLTPGVYYMAVQWNDLLTNAYTRQANVANVSGSTWTYTAATPGIFETPCPAASATNSFIPIIHLRRSA